MKDEGEEELDAEMEDVKGEAGIDGSAKTLWLKKSQLRSILVTILAGLINVKS